MNNPWDAIHAERRGLLEDLEGLDDAQWNAPSSCAGWTVREVVGHVIATAKITPPAFLAGMVASGFQFHKMNNKRAAAEAKAAPGEMLDQFRNIVDKRNKPPGPVDAMVGEIIVHGEDVRRPLGLSHMYNTDALITAADFYRSGNLLIGGKRRATGVTMAATDLEWRAGDGPVVQGPMRALVSAIAGRRDALADLDGPGVDGLRSRMP